MILTPGWRLTALVLGAVDERNDLVNRVLGQALRDELLAVEVVLHVAAQDRVERVVGRQRIRVELVRAKLGGGRAIDDRLGDRPAVAVAPARERVDERLLDVLDHSEAAGKVAIERGVADRHLRLVAGRQHEPAELVRQCHQQVATDSRLKVLLCEVGLAPRERVFEQLAVALDRSVDRKLE